MKPLVLQIVLIGLVASGVSFGDGVTTGVGRIAGKIESAQKVVRVAAVDRVFADVLKTSQAKPKDPFLYEGVVEDGAMGKFHVEGLVAGHQYDLIVWTADGKGEMTRWEGVNMDYHREVLPGKEMTGEDRTWLEGFVKDMPAFYDKCRVLHMAGDHSHATLLVELARTRDFHSDKGGEVIYRVELWYFENLFGGWAKDKNTEKVMVRWRGEGKGIEKNWQFLVGLGGIVAGGDEVKVTLPDAAEGKLGLAGGMH